MHDHPTLQEIKVDERCDGTIEGDDEAQHLGQLYKEYPNNDMQHVEVTGISDSRSDSPSQLYAEGTDNSVSFVGVEALA